MRTPAAVGRRRGPRAEARVPGCRRGTGRRRSVPPASRASCGSAAAHAADERIRRPCPAPPGRRTGSACRVARAAGRAARSMRLGSTPAADRAVGSIPSSSRSRRNAETVTTRARRSSNSRPFRRAARRRIACGSLCRNSMTGQRGNRRARAQRDFGPVVDLDQRRTQRAQHARHAGGIARVHVARSPERRADGAERHVVEDRAGLASAKDQSGQHAGEATHDQPHRAGAAGPESFPGGRTMAMSGASGISDMDRL